jgi:hypothetical protein
MSESGYINRAKTKAPFCQIPNKFLQDKTISLKAKGLLGYLVSLPSEWKVFKSNLYNYLSEGREAINSAWRELVDNGYIVSRRITYENGKFNGWIHDVYLEPTYGFPESRENRLTEKPTDGKPVNKEILYKPNTIKQNKEDSIRVKKIFVPPTEEEFILYFTENGFSDKVGKEAFDYYTRMEWKDSRGVSVKNWKLKAKGVWFTEKNKKFVEPVKKAREGFITIGDMEFRKPFYTQEP